VGFELIRLITFDCYGTLIDWESGLLGVLRPIFSHNNRGVPDAQLLERYAEAEAQLETGPYLPYRRVLARAVEGMAESLNLQVSPQQAGSLAESIKRWEPFPDTVAALARLSRHFQLGIISNIDDDLFALTRPKLKADFALVVTAQQVRSYKPSFANFQEALRRSGLKKEEVLHAAQSVYHDVVPATALGLQSVWVNRPSARPGTGVAKSAAGKPTATVANLDELAVLLLGRNDA
jgi:2-haloacid dehalogenase